MKGRELFIKALDLSLRKTGLYNAIFRSIPKKSNKKMKFPLPLKDIKHRSVSISGVQLMEDVAFGNALTAQDISFMAQSNTPFWKTSWRGFDPKDFWEIARGWQWLPAVLEANSPEQRRQILDKIMDWLGKNPCPNGLAWAVGLDVAIRAINLLMIFTISGEERLTPHLSTHLEYLRRMLWLSRYAIRNNHYLGELTAMALLSRALGETSAERWKDEMKEELTRQFYPDGVNVEQSVRYHFFSLQFAVIARLLLEADVPFLEKSGEFLLATMKPDGTWPSIGDDDSGCIFRLHKEGPGGDYKSMLSILALLFERPDFAFAAGRLYPEAELLMENAEEKWSNIEAKIPEQKTFIFPNGGYLSARSSWDRQASYIMIKFGPHKWHAHADLFHVEVSLSGKPVFVDSGTYRYNNIPEERKYFRSTPAHNTVCFDARDQSKQLRTFRWLASAQITRQEIQETPEGLACHFSHSGYKLAGIIHERRIFIPKGFNFVQIEDRVLGTGKGPLELFWHLSPGVDAKQIYPGLFEITAGSGRLGTLVIESQTDLSINVTETPWSEAYGKLGSQKTIMAKIEKESEKELMLVSFIEPRPNNTSTERISA